MIIVKLMGGMGNQMFQYAFGKQLALKHNVKLKLDLTEISNVNLNGNYSVRELGLDNFNIDLTIATKEEIKVYKGTKISKLINLLLLYSPIKANKLYIREPYFHFFKKALIAPKDSYLDGYWQSEKYFSRVRSELINDFTLKSKLSEESKLLSQNIGKQNSVSIHVRKGDYLSIAANKNLYEDCGPAYYKKSMEKIAGLVNDPVFYLFSDDPEWFKKNVSTTFKVEYVTHNRGKDSYQDIYLMSLCKHNIIANSSFSWWGAWLNTYKDKIVIAPKKWFKNDSKDSSDLIPETWIRL